MISDEEIRKIKKLINQGKSDYRIGKELGHSPNTVKKFREKYKISEVSHNNIWNMLFKNPIDDVLELIKNIKNIVNTAELKAEVRCELEKLLEKLQKIVRLEVDDRISKVKTDAIEKRDKEWSKVIDQSYVKKDVVTDLNNAIKEMDNKIATHNYKIDQKDQVIASIRQENKCLKNQIRNLLWQKIGLEENIGNLNDFIDNYLDKAGQREREKLRHEEKDLMIKKTDFDRHMDIQQTNLDKIYLEINKKQGAVEKREKKMAKQDENIKKQKQELKTTWKKMLEIKKNLEKWQEQINNQIENIKKNWKNVLKTAKELRTE